MYNVGKAAFYIACILFLSASLQASQQNPNSHEYWDLEDIYPNEESWQQDLSKVMDSVSAIPLSLNIETPTSRELLNALNKLSIAKRQVARLYTYAALKVDEDLGNANNRVLLQKAIKLHGETVDKNAALYEGIANLTPETITRFLSEETDLKKHAFELRDIQRQAPHLRKPDGKGKKLRQATSQPTPALKFQHLQDKVINWPAIIRRNGQAAVITPAGYAYYRSLPDPSDREIIFDKYWNTVEKHGSYFAKILNEHIDIQREKAEQRNYKNSLEAILSKNNIPITVYETLIKSARHSLPTLHRLLKLKQRLLQLDRLEYHDIHAPTSHWKTLFTLEQAKALNISALQPLGTKYIEILSSGFKKNWMHTHPTLGKRSGAYMQDAAYDVHPYILLNFRGSYKDVGSFTHEWGHAVHSILSQRNTMFETSRYSPFLAELVAATNEIFLQNHMIRASSSSEEKLYYLLEALETYRVSYFFHALQAEFEYIIHSKRNAGETLTPSKLSELYLHLMRQYYGHNIGVMWIAAKYAMEWAMIPHLYNSFSIYLHATGIAGSTLVTHNILNDVPAATQQYIAALKTGGSEYPHNILKGAGVDLSSPKPYQALEQHMNKLMDEVDALLASSNK